MSEAVTEAVTEAASEELEFGRKVEPFDYLMFRGEQDPRTRSAMLLLSLLESVPDFERVRAAFDRASRVVLRMRQHIVVPTIAVTAPEWIVDPDFDLTYHLRQVALPGPGTTRQLLDYAQGFLASPFDTARPLWEAVVVEGITEGGLPAALLLKVSHTLTDGVGGLQLLLQLLDVEPAQDRGAMPFVPVPEDVTPETLTRKGLSRLPISALRGAGRTAAGAVQAGWRAAGNPAGSIAEVNHTIQSARRVLGPPPVPPSPLLRRRGLGRRLDYIEFPLDRLRQATKTAGGSVNDAYLSGLCGALRRYHEAKGVKVDRLPFAIPVSLRSGDDPVGGNRFAGARIAAPVGEADPAKRIGLIRQAVLHSVAEPAIDVLGVVAPVLSLLPAPVLSSLASVALSTDVQASNIVGYPEPPYIGGVKMAKTLPFGPLPGVPLMVVMVTQGGVCYVGAHYDTAAINDAELFATCLHEGFQEVLALAPGSGGKPSRRRTVGSEP